MADGRVFDCRTTLGAGLLSCLVAAFAFASNRTCDGLGKQPAQPEFLFLSLAPTSASSSHFSGQASLASPPTSTDAGRSFQDSRHYTHISIITVTRLIIACVSFYSIPSRFRPAHRSPPPLPSPFRLFQHPAEAASSPLFPFPPIHPILATMRLSVSVWCASLYRF